MARLCFLGSPAVAADVLSAFIDAGHEIALVVSGPDRRRARGGTLSPTPVKAVALEHDIPVSTVVDDVVSCGAELGIVVAYGALIKEHVLAELAMVNLHFSLLPRWRGAAPVERAVLAGDEETGVCVMAVEKGLDTGGIFASARVAIEEHEHADALTRRLGVIGTELLLEAVRDGRASLGEPAPQVGEATYAKKLTADELVLDWQRPARELERIVRAGRAATSLSGKRLLVRDAHAHDEAAAGEPGTLEGARVATGAGVLELLEVQLEGRSAASFEEFARGARVHDGTRLGS